MATTKLVQRALKEATSAQLIRVRGLLGMHSGQFGYDSWQDKIKNALVAFDAEEYDHPDIAFLLCDVDLGEALR